MELDTGNRHSRRTRGLTLAALTAFAALVACAGGSDAARPANAGTTDAVPASATPALAAPSETPAKTCAAVMHRTRACADVYLPELLALRVRLDLPAGIAARFESEGEAAMLELAHAQFARDWSDERIAQNCDELSRKPPLEQERIIAPERECLQTTECSAFSTCDLAHKEKRWTAPAREPTLP